MGSLSEFQELVNDLKDEELLTVAEELLRDMVEIQNMKEKIEILEESLTKGNRAAFWWFAMGLDRDQVDLATNTVIGRRRFLHDMSEREKMKHPDYVAPPTMSEIRKQQAAERKAYEERLEVKRSQITPEMVADARAAMPAEMLEEFPDLTDKDIQDMILHNEGGSGQFGPKFELHKSEDDEDDI